VIHESPTFPSDGDRSLPDRAEDYIANYVLWMISSEEHLSARAAAVKCGCNSCVQTYNDYVDFLAGDEFEGQFDQYKLTPRNQVKHIDWYDL